MKHLIFAAALTAFEKGSSSTFQQHGIIICIPKLDEDKRYLKNWRPITLLNVDYKIISATIAARLNTVIPSLISEHQTGFIKGRYMGENTRVIYDIIEHCNKKQIPGLLLMLDFEKAFDTLEWPFLFKVLKSVGFGDNINRWIKLLYNNAKSCVLCNGHMTPFFDVGRGYRQGDPLSAPIFLISVEMLSIAIRENPSIKGLKTGNVTHILKQFADDTQIFLQGDEHSFREVFRTLMEFSKASGLRVNVEKSKAIWLGSQKTRTDTFYPEFSISWSKDNFKILGITFSLNQNEIAELNYSKQLNKARKLIFSWSRRQLTLIGKVTVVKTLVLPLFTHLFSSLPNPDKHFFKTLDNLIYKFIWNGKRDRIKRTTLVSDYMDGGLKMIHMKSFAGYMKLSSLKRLYSSEGYSKEMFQHMYCDMGGDEYIPLRKKPSQ